MKDVETWFNKLSNRELNFIVFILSFYGYPLLLPANRELVLNSIRDMYARNHSKIDDIENFCKSRMIDESLFGWLRNDTRALLWMYAFYNYQSPFSDIPKSYVQASPSLFENFVYNIDVAYYSPQQPLFTPTNLSPMPFGNFWFQDSIPLQNFYTNAVVGFDFSLTNKVDYLNLAKSRYTERRTDRKNVNWIDKNNEDQIYWAIDYLKSNNLLLNVNGFLAYTNDDLHDLICASLDIIDTYIELPINQQYSLSAYKQLIISKMRKAWSQKKFRDKKDIEAAQDLLLTRKAKKQLSELSSAYGTSSVEILTDLIDTAYQNAKN